MRSEYFDRIWRTHGERGLGTVFNTMLGSRRDDLCAAIADDGNSFPVMYVLAGEIERSGLEGYLPEHVVYAYWIICCKIEDEERREKFASMLPHDESGQPAPNHKALKWMIATGADWDGPSPGRDSFDASIDLAAAYLALYCPDAELMKKIVELIFRRNRRHLLIHDLVWGFFQTADASALSAIAAFIVSDNQADSNLACELLGIEPVKSRAEKRDAHKKFTEWLSENRPYIYLTGESLNASSVPRHMDHDRAAKYIKKEIHPRTRETLSPLTDEEREALAVFRSWHGGGDAI